MSRIIVLDFDGVICDSACECAIVSWFAFRDGNWLDVDHELYSDGFIEFRSRFQEYRYLVGPPWEYAALAKALHSDCDIVQKFKEHRQKLILIKEILTEHFFKTRTDLKSLDAVRWASWNPLYPEMKNQIQISIESVDIYISTMKNKLAVMDILSFNGIKFPSDKIIDIAFGDKKSAHFEFLSHKIDCRNAKFIDDNKRHLTEVEPSGAECYFANWGYGRDSGHFQEINMCDLAKLFE